MTAARRGKARGSGVLLGEADATGSARRYAMKRLWAKSQLSATSCPAEAASVAHGSSHATRGPG